MSTFAHKRSQFILVAAALLTLLAAMWAGLLRMGWQIPPLSPALAGSHGPLMVSGFLGTLIGVERAVGLGKRWTYLAPALTGLGAVALIAGLPAQAGALAIALGSLVLVGVFAFIVKQQPALHALAMALAAVLWLVGNLLWLFGLPIPVVVPWWAGYLVLTIAGERLELSRLLFLSGRAKAAFFGAVALVVAGMVVVINHYSPGWRIIGAGLLALAVWLLTHDIARRTIRQAGLTRFIATCMLSGYLWLGIAGALALGYGFLAGGMYDAVLHSVFLGFVMAMIFGHAPIIFPAVLGTPMPFRTAFYGHLGLLHLSLLLRVAGGVAEWLGVRQWGGMLNVFAILLFLGNTLLAVRAGRTRKKG